MSKALIVRVGGLTLGILNLTLWAAAATAPVLSQTLPESTAIPIRFEHSIDTKSAKPGDPVIAKTMQVIVLPGGNQVAKGTVILGHIVASKTFHFDATPYAHQSPSTLSIHFDKLQSGSSAIPVNLAVRALADALDSRQAAYPHSTDDTDHVGVINLIGGIAFSPLDHMIKSEDGDAIGYNRKNGVFARLIPGQSSGAGTVLRCDGTSAEQSVAIYSPSACGVYGFGGVYMLENGQDGSGTFTLTERGRSMKLYAGTTALLQVISGN
jgi:hypothetical protein